MGNSRLEAKLMRLNEKARGSSLLRFGKLSFEVFVGTVAELGHDAKFLNYSLIIFKPQNRRQKKQQDILVDFHR